MAYEVDEEDPFFANEDEEEDQDEADIIEAEKKEDEDDDKDILDDEEAEEFQQTEIQAPVKRRSTLPIMTPYERDELIGQFGVLIQKNYPIDFEIGTEINPTKIAMIALKLKVIPLIVRRDINAKEYEDWKASELKTEDELRELAERGEELVFDANHNSSHITSTNFTSKIIN
jgi:hypothetical protein